MASTVAVAEPPPTDVPPLDIGEVLRALADPMRWEMMTRIAAVQELPCIDLWRDLPISKATVSHHIKVLADAGLIDIRKGGRQFYYAARRKALATAIREMYGTLVKPSTPAQESR